MIVYAINKETLHGTRVVMYYKDYQAAVECKQHLEKAHSQEEVMFPKYSVEAIQVKEGGEKE